MATLKETKDRISSVKTTLKTTSAMKMVASARLHKGQSMIENMRPYEKRLADMLQVTLQCVPDSEELKALCRKREAVEDPESVPAEKIAIVAMSSNSSLCGAFNSNVIKEASARVAELKKEGAEVIVFSIGRKMAEAMKKLGFTTPEDLNSLIAHPSYEPVAQLAQKLTEAFLDGTYDRVELIHNHFVSTASQKVVCETFLPMERINQVDGTIDAQNDYIMEPTASELISALLPRVLRLKVYTAVLDSNAAEHAARTVAMQTATDNGEALLQDLTLEYNKGRQQKITSEILDIVGGSLN